MITLIVGALWFEGEPQKEAKPPAPVPRIVSLTVLTDKTEVKIKEFVIFKVRGKFSDGSEKEITQEVEWRSSNPAVAIADPGGRVVGQKAGNADITVHYAGVVSHPLTLFVKEGEPSREPSPPVIQIVSLSVHTDKRGIKVNERVALKLRGIYSDGKEAEIAQGVQWQSRDRSIAAVDRRGRVVGQKRGSVDITARYAGVVSPPLTLIIKGSEKGRDLKAFELRKIKNHIDIAKSYRERGEYSNALSELQKASLRDPTNKKVQAEIEITKMACNAEKRLGRPQLKC